jgi:hypothetical protein
MERIRDRFGWTLALAVALVIVAASLCVFDQGHDPMGDHGMSQDLCAGLLVVSLAVPLLAGPGVTGWYRPALVRSFRITRVRSLDPPPKFRSLR